MNFCVDQFRLAVGGRKKLVSSRTTLGGAVVILTEAWSRRPIHIDDGSVAGRGVTDDGAASRTTNDQYRPLQVGSGKLVVAYLNVGPPS